MSQVKITKEYLNLFLRRFRQGADAQLDDAFRLLKNNNLTDAQGLFNKHFKAKQPTIINSIVREPTVCLGSNGLTVTDHQDITARVKELVADNRFDTLPAKTWLNLGRVVSACGFIEAGSACRDHALECVMAEQPRDSLSLINAAQAALETDNFDRCAGYLKTIRDDKRHAPACALIWKHLEHVAPSYFSADLQLIENTACMRTPSSLMQGASIALVGPALIPEDRGSEIESHDLVARIAYSGIDSIPKGTGTRADVSFYAGHKVRGLVERHRLDALSELKLLILKHEADIRLLHERGFPLDRLQSSIGGKELFYATGPNAGPEMVLNCLNLGARVLSIHNTNLFLSTGYPMGYVANKTTLQQTSYSYSSPPNEFCWSFSSGHHPAAQFRFYKRLYNVGRIKGDSQFEKIMEMRTGEYVRELDLIYGRWAWNAIS